MSDDIFNKSKWDIDDLYELLVSHKPVTTDAIRVWEGIANTIYLKTKTDFTGFYTSKMEKIQELAQEYGVNVPSKPISDTLQFINLSKQIKRTDNEQREQNLPEQFERKNSNDEHGGLGSK